MTPDEPSTEMLPGQPPATTEAAPAQALPSLIGRVLGGRFTIVAQLGRGGSGEVYRADQTQLGRSAVIKVLRRDVTTGANRVERFLREAKLASRLDHPYAAHIYAFGVEPDNTLWIAMEHVKGITLDELVLKRGAMPATIFAPLFARLCEVVHTAHELGIVHRDIKGANVMVIERAAQLLPKLLDFGIAKSETAVTSPGADDGELTAHGATLGSPHYMSPEQWTNPADVDARSDIYALGVLAYRCLAGHLPFHTLARNQLAQAHIAEPVPRMPDFVSAPLADAIARALDKDPDKRWPHAVAFADAIQRAAGTTIAEAVPIFDPTTRDAWLRAGPQPIADALAHLTSATTTVESDGALRDLVAITCRWLAVLALSGLPTATPASDPRVRERARAVAGRDDGSPWLALAQAAVAATPEALPALATALAAADRLAALAARLDERDRSRTAAALAADVATAAEALLALEPLLAYQLAVGLPDGAAESWQGPRRRERERVLVWGPPLAPGEVALLDAGGRVVARLSPFAQVIAPLPSAEPELFLLWRSGRGAARLIAAPWGFERDDERAGHVLAVLSTEDSDTALDAADERSPYPGLAAYGVEDADHFVGREREVEALANRLVRSPLVAVLGPSGVGKSSFIHAGLVARLGDAHRVLTMRPGRHPMHALAALPPVSGDSHDESALVTRLRELGDSAQRGLVLVVDQLEEMVTLCADPAERTRFAETLAAAASGPQAPVRVVATLRDDFATVIESEAALRGRFDVFVLAAPPPDALRRIVVEPARHANVTIDPRVVDDMVAAVAGTPASLPLLSFTGAQLWQTRDRAARKITYEAYQELGGVAGALATYADQVYASLARRDQDTVRDLFARLVASDGTRIPSPRRELEQLPGAPGVLAHLVDARLLVVRDDEGTDVVELVHECLAERWPRLARWRSEDAADRALIGDLRAAARRWHEASRRSDLLWRGQAATELGRLASRSSALTELERAFATETVRAQHRARRVRRGIVVAVMAVLAAAAGVMAYLSIAANESRAEAERSASAAAQSATLAEERLTASLLAQGRRELNDNRPFPALAYFAAAMRRGSDSQGLRAMVSIAARGFRDVIASHHPGQTSGIVGSPSGWFVAGDSQGVVRWWSDRGELLGEVTSELGPIISVERLDDDHVFATGQKGIIELDANRKLVRHVQTGPAWSARRGPGADEITSVGEGWIYIYGLDGALRRKLPSGVGSLGGEPTFTGNGRYALMWHEDVLRLVDLVTLRDKVLSKQAHGLFAASRDGSRFAFIDRELVVHLHAGDGALVTVLPKSTRPLNLAFSATGDRFAVAYDSEMAIFDGKGERLGRTYIPKDQHLIILRDDDAWLAGPDGVLRHYHDGNLAASTPVAATEVVDIAVARDAVATLTGDGLISIVRANATHLIFDPPICERVSYSALGATVGYECGDKVKFYSGRELVGEVPFSDTQPTIDMHEASHRSVVTADDVVYVFERGKPIAKATKRAMAAFDDADHIFVAEQKTVWRWTFATDVWERVIDVPEVDSVSSLPGGTLIVATRAGTLLVIANGKETHRLDVGSTIAAIARSWDARWLALQIDDGVTAMVDTGTWQIIRKLPPADNYGGAPAFDASGELLLRSSRQTLSIWDTTTGDELVYGLDLLEQTLGARFLPDGRIEVNQREPGLLDIPRDMRPIPEILRDIDCKVPLEVVGSRIQPRTVRCGGQ